MVRKSFLVILFVGTVLGSQAQKLVGFEIELTKPTNGMDIPASVNLDQVSFVADSLLTLVEVNGSTRTAVPFQITQGRNRTLHWMIGNRSDGTKKRQYELIKGKPAAFEQINAVMKDGSLTIQSANKNLLRYWYQTVYPPAGVDSSFKRSGFIHPLWTPNGHELTRIQAPDHYHHYGIWNPWTHVLFEGDTVDFWNIRGKQGTVRFGKFASVTSGPVFSEFKVLHEHVAFKKKPEKIALNEIQTVRVYKPANNQDYYIADITIELNCATESPFLILEYRYAGLGWRATEKWNKDNSEVLTSEGKNRKEADGSTGKWFIVQGSLDNDYGGAVMMSYPSNYNHPEPMRIWPENSNRVGEMFAMFAPTKNTNWLLKPGRTYSLNYRFVVFNGKFTSEKAEAAWQYFSNQPKVIIK